MRTSTKANNSIALREKETVSISEYEELIDDFCDRICFDLPDIRHEFPAEPEVLDHFRLLGLEHDYLVKAIKIGKMSAALADMTYRFLPHPVRIVIGVYTTYLILIDDLGTDFPYDLMNFGRRVLQGQEQPNLVLRAFLSFLPSFGEFYGEYACDMIYKSSIEFVSSCTLENRYDKHQGRLVPSGAALFPQFFRFKTGASEAYAHFSFLKADFPEDEYLDTYLFAIPDMENLFNHINDLLSFYKESIASTERFNYVYNFANAQGLSVRDALQDVCDFVVASIASARRILAPHPLLEKIFTEVIEGYTAWHWFTERYRLDELRIRVQRGGDVPSAIRATLQAVQC